MVPLPASEETIILFATHLAQRIKPQAMNVYLAAVRSLHISNGLSNPLQPGLRLKQTLRGIFFSTEAKDAAYIRHSLRYSDFYHPHVWRWHGAMGRHHRWSFSYAPRRRIYSSFSRPFRSVFSPHLLWRAFIFLSPGTEYHSLRVINLNGSATTGFDPLYCSFRTIRLCWLRYEKESRPSPSPWYRRQGYYALVSPFRPTPRQQNIPCLFHLSLATLSRYWPLPLQWLWCSYQRATSTSLAGLTDYEIKLIGRWNYQRYLHSFSLQLFLDLLRKITQTRAITFQYATPYMFNEPAVDH